MKKKRKRDEALERSQRDSNVATGRKESATMCVRERERERERERGEFVERRRALGGTRDRRSQEDERARGKRAG